MRTPLTLAVLAVFGGALAGLPRPLLAGDDASNGARYASAGSAPCAPPCPPPMSREEACTSARCFFDDYVPAVPVGPTRTTFTTLVMPPTPWLGTEGEAGTPACGRVE